jgi:hypothetical protein
LIFIDEGAHNPLSFEQIDYPGLDGLRHEVPLMPAIEPTEFWLRTLKKLWVLKAISFRTVEMPFKAECPISAGVGKDLTSQEAVTSEMPDNERFPR